MPFFSLVAIYFILWWLCLFFVLPFGVRNQSDGGVIEPGTEPGAPRTARIAKIALVNTAVSAVFMALVMWALTNPTLQEYWR